MPTKEQVLTMVQARGPVIPSQIMRALGGDTMIIGAMLSDLAREKKVKISKTKIGGSPTYYVSGQEPKLETLFKYLNSKDRETAQELKEKKVIREDTQSPLRRVSLQQIKDFSKRVEVKLKEGPVVYWRWHLVSEEEAAELIKTELGLNKPKEEETIEKKPAVKEETKKEEKKTVVKKIPKPEKTEQKTLTKEQEKDTTPFYEQLEEYFNKNNIEVQSSKIIKKKTHYEFEVRLMSTVGRLNYYCVARNKKNNNDGDLSQAYVQGTKKGTPVLYITTGKVTKKAMKLLETDFKNMTIKQL